MKTFGWIALSALLLGLPAARAQQVLAASSAPPPPKVGTALPPPGINDPGAKPQAVPLPSTGIPPSLAPAARQAAGQGDSTNVTSHVDANGDTVEEYGRGGVVESVRVIPKHGPVQTYHRNSTNGSLVRDPNLGPVAPVYYTLYKWDGARKQVPPASAATAPSPPPPPASGS